jgi:beta-lactamase class A
MMESNPSPDAPQPRAWTRAAVDLLAEPDRDAATTIALGANFPVQVSSDRFDVSGTTWVEVRWQTPNREGIGWIPALDLAFEGPSGAALDAELGNLVASLGDRVGVAVLDITGGTVYSHNGDRSYIAASSIKVPIMLRVEDGERREDALAVAASQIRQGNPRG